MEWTHFNTLQCKIYILKIVLDAIRNKQVILKENQVHTLASHRRADNKRNRYLETKFCHLFSKFKIKGYLLVGSSNLYIL